MLTLGMDPGASNFAWALQESIEETRTLVDHGYLIPVEGNQFAAFAARVERLLDFTCPDEVIFERYQFRGAQSTTAEPVNLMLGVIIRICDKRGLPWYRITASQWKTHYKKPLKKNEEPDPKDAAKPDRPEYGLKAHEADAGCIAHYHDTYWRERRPFAEAEAEKKRLRDEAKKAAAKKAKQKARRKKKKKKTE